jgi:hypothetical protein
MTLLVAVAIVTIPIEYVVNDVPALAWAWSAIGSTLGAALAASVYVELERRAPWTGPRVQGSKGSEGPVRRVLRVRSRGSGRSRFAAASGGVKPAGSCVLLGNPGTLRILRTAP